MELKGKTALVTGASRGIGPHLATALAGRGMNLVLTGRSESELELVAAEQRKRGVRVLTVVTDLLDDDARTLLVGAAERALEVGVAHREVALPVAGEAFRRAGHG